MGHSVNWARVPRDVVTRAADSTLDDNSVAFIETDLSDIDHVSVRQNYHTIFIQLGGTFERHEASVGQGSPFSEIPRVGSLWVIPAHHHYRASIEASVTQCCEVHVPLKNLRGEEISLTPQLNAHDEVMHAAAVLCMQVAKADDDVSALVKLQTLDLMRTRITDRYSIKKQASDDFPQQLSPVNQQLLVTYIHTHFSERIALDDLVRITGLPPQRLFVEFRASFGLTPAQYVIEHRIATSKVMLRGSKRSISEIAVKTGFSSIAHFSNSFRIHTGTTPRVFRNQC